MDNLLKLTNVLVISGVALALGCGPDIHSGTDVPEVSTDTFDTGQFQFADDPSVPQTCEDVRRIAAEGHATTVGCEFYAHSLDRLVKEFNFAVVLANVNFREDAHYTVYGLGTDDETQESGWIELQSGRVRPLEEKVIDKNISNIQLNDNIGLFFRPDLLNPQAVLRDGAYKIVSDVPIVAYQFNPLNAGSATSDASTLIPVSAWSPNYQVVGYQSIEVVDAGYFGNTVNHVLAYAAIVAAKDNTEVSINPSTRLRPGYTDWFSDDIIVPGGSDPFTVTLNEADVLYIHADLVGASLSGTTIQTDESHPVAVFTGHQCAMIPRWAQACDNVEEQLPGINQWGTSFVAARLPNRNRTNYTDPVLWQISAAEDNTTVSFQADDHVRGLPEGDIVLAQGEVVDLYVYGSFVHPGDFIIQANKPIAVLEYMTGARAAQDATGAVIKLGDPALAYVAPTAQFLTRYVVHVPRGWEQDYLIITRPVGNETFVDGILVDNSIFKTVAGSNWQVGRLPVNDGNYVVESSDKDQRLGLLVVGMDENDSYAYSGGMGFAVLYDPQ